MDICLCLDSTTGFSSSQTLALAIEEGRIPLRMLVVQKCYQNWHSGQSADGHKKRGRGAQSRMPGFLSSRRNGYPSPLSRSECCPPPPPLVAGGDTLATGRGDRGSHFGRRDRHFASRRSKNTIQYNKQPIVLSESLGH
jgi:hypothetical protein